LTIFAIVPVEVCADPRLTKMQLRVLICLLSFRAKNSDTIWPKRSTIAERCGYNIRTISKVTTQLVNLGWLVKEGSGGFSQSCKYKITVPELDTVVETDNGNQTGYGNQSGYGNRTGHLTVTEVVTPTVTEPDRGNKQTIEQTKNIPTPSVKYSPEDLEFATWAYKKILGPAPKAPKPDFTKWADSVRLMREVDNHTPQEIMEVFTFANNDPFWQTNILSIPKLRQKFSTLHSKMLGGSNATSIPIGRTYQTKSERADAKLADYLLQHS
jgi:hypothetical protein